MREAKWALPWTKIGEMKSTQDDPKALITAPKQVLLIWLEVKLL